METVAVRVPVQEGSKVMSKVVEPPAAMEADGAVVTLKSSAWVPPSAT